MEFLCCVLYCDVLFYVIVCQVCAKFEVMSFVYVCFQPMEVYVDDEAKLTLHVLQQHYVKLQDKEKNRKLFDLLDVLEFNQVFSKLEQCSDTLPMMETAVVFRHNFLIKVILLFGHAGYHFC